MLNPTRSIDNKIDKIKAPTSVFINLGKNHRQKKLIVNSKGKLSIQLFPNLHRFRIKPHHNLFHGLGYPLDFPLGVGMEA